jgi:3-methyladenine DNA glycosylase/8-oxoguanine DNA glycosylase
VTKVGAGRLLISPTVWEDLAKTLLTTNTTWNVTVQMCRRLATLGDHYDGGGNCFPAPQQIASLTLKDLTDQVRAGYRSAYLYELATAIAEGKISVEEWRNTELTTEELYRRISSLKGFGDYASGSMLKLLGRFDRLGIDTSCREVFKVQLNGGKNASDDEIRAYYEPFGDWRGLVMWMDVMKVNLLAKLNPS